MNFPRETRQKNAPVMFSKNHDFRTNKWGRFPKCDNHFSDSNYCSSFPPKVLALCQLGDASAVAAGMDLDSRVMDQRILAPNAHNAEVISYQLYDLFAYPNKIKKYI